MNTREEIMEFDEVLGSQEEIKLSDQDIALIRSYRKKFFEERTEKDRISDRLTALRFSLMKYLDSQDSDHILGLGDFLVDLLDQLKIKRGVFASYIEISPRNINKYFGGERKFTIDHALKFEQLFQVPAEIFLEVQLKNELLKAKRSSRKTYEKYDLNDLLVV